MKKYLTVEAALLGVDQNISLYFKDLTQNYTVSLDPQRSWIPASTIKAFVVLEAFRQRRIGLIDFNKQITITAQNVVPTELESPEFPRLREGVKATIRQLIEAMVTQSDNTAYNTLLDILDRRNINATLRQIGITETVVGEKLNLDDGQFQTDLAVPGRQPNSTTAKDMAALFEYLYRGGTPDAAEMLSIFKRQKINSMIPVFIPAAISIAHKTGDWAPIYHDGGIIYKTQSPFVLTVFTNSGDQRVLSKLGYVAYTQTAQSVGANPPVARPQQLTQRPQTVYIAEEPTSSEVLGDTSSDTGVDYVVQPNDSLSSIGNQFYTSQSDWGQIAAYNHLDPPYTISAGQVLHIPNPQKSTTDKFPAVTAADLGVTSADLNHPEADAAKTFPALLTSQAPLYVVKQWIENLKINLSSTQDAKAESYISRANDRVHELKTAVFWGADINTINKILDDTQTDLNTAIHLGKNSDKLDTVLSDVSHTSNLQFAVLGQVAAQIPDAKKEDFVDAVYNAYTQNQQQVQPSIEQSLSADPLNQQPLTGTVSDIKNNTATVTFSDGSSKQVEVTPDVTTRDFNSTTPDNTATVAVGSKIAVVTDHVEKDKIVPKFILRNIPKELPEKHSGTVIKVDSAQSTIEIKDQNGKTIEVKVNDTTIIKSKDTEVSIDGIKAGSHVSVFGTPVQESSSSAQTATEESPTNVSSQSSDVLVLASPSPSRTTTKTDQKSAASPAVSPTKSTNTAAKPAPSVTIQNSTKPAPAASIKSTTTTTGSTNKVPTPATTVNTTQTVTIKNTTTITVTKNASGKDEKAQTPPAPPAPAKPAETKSEPAKQTTDIKPQPAASSAPAASAKK